MADTQHFCLRWNNYQSSITSAFENLRDDEDFVDVTLACDGRSIKAHRVVLSACSPYFRELLKSTPCKHPVIVLQDVSFPDLHALVEFIYHGEVNVHQRSLSSFLKTAEVLRVSGLTQKQAEESHSQLEQIQNLAATGIGSGSNSGIGGNNIGSGGGIGGGAIGSGGNIGCGSTGARTPITHHQFAEKLHHDDTSTIFPNCGVSPPSVQQHPMSNIHHSSPHTNAASVNQLLRRAAAAAAFRRDRHNSTQSDEQMASTLKRQRSNDNGILINNNNNSPDLNSQHPQIQAADYSTIKHNNNNTPPIKDDKSEIYKDDGNGPTGNGNGILSNDKDSLTPSPPARLNNDHVKSEPMELVCSNNNPITDDHSNDSTGEHDANRSSSGDIGKGSLSSANDDEMDNSIHSHHPPPPFLMSPGESKLFSTPGSFNFSMAALGDPAALAGFNQLHQTAADLAGSPQGCSPKKLFSCQLCGKVLCSKASLKRHIADKHAERQEEYRCIICERVYCSRNSLMTHIYTYHKSRPGGPQNAIISATTNISSSTQNSTTTSSSSPYSPMASPPGCGGNGGGSSGTTVTTNNHNDKIIIGNCGGGGGGRSQSTSPINNGQVLRMPPPTSGGINEPQECPYCRRTFSCYYSLKRHFQDKHEQSDTLYVCEFCHRRYRTKNSLTTHKSLQHRGTSGMLKRLLKTSAIKNVLGGGGGGGHSHHHHHSIGHSARPHLFNFGSDMIQSGPGSNYPGDLEFGKALTSTLMGNGSNGITGIGGIGPGGNIGGIGNNVNNNGGLIGEYGGLINNKKELLNDWSELSKSFIGGGGGGPDSPISIIKQQIQ